MVAECGEQPVADCVQVGLDGGRIVVVEHETGSAHRGTLDHHPRAAGDEGEEGSGLRGCCELVPARRWSIDGLRAGAFVSEGAWNFAAFDDECRDEIFTLIDERLHYFGRAGRYGDSFDSELAGGLGDGNVRTAEGPATAHRDADPGAAKGT